MMKLKYGEINKMMILNVFGQFQLKNIKYFNH
jgi:hypothetical protein